MCRVIFNCKPALDGCFWRGSLTKETPESLHPLGMCTQSSCALPVPLGARVIGDLGSSNTSLDSSSTSMWSWIVLIFQLGPALAQPSAEDNQSSSAYSSAQPFVQTEFSSSSPTTLRRAHWCSPVSKLLLHLNLLK